MKTIEQAVLEIYPKAKITQINQMEDKVVVKLERPSEKSYAAILQTLILDGTTLKQLPFDASILDKI